MKKKGNRNIPDFSRKSPKGPPTNEGVPAKTSVPRTAHTIKPQSTSSKSGRRGT